MNALNSQRWLWKTKNKKLPQVTISFVYFLILRIKHAIDARKNSVWISLVAARSLCSSIPSRVDRISIEKKSGVHVGANRQQKTREDVGDKYRCMCFTLVIYTRRFAFQMGKVYEKKKKILVHKPRRRTTRHRLPVTAFAVKTRHG